MVGQDTDGDYGATILLVIIIVISSFTGFLIGNDYGNGGLIDSRSEKEGQYYEMINAMNIQGDCIKVFQITKYTEQYKVEYYEKINKNGTDTWVLLKDTPVQSLSNSSGFEKNGQNYGIEYCKKLVE